MSFWSLPSDVRGDARFEGEEHRLWLERWRGEQRDRSFVLFVGMNPSMAGAERDDMTIRKDMEFARRMGFHRIVKCNVATRVSTDPKELKAIDAIHPLNLKTVPIIANAAALIVLATGNVPDFLEEPARILFRALTGGNIPVKCFGLTKDGWPKHTSRLAYDTPLVPFK